jgi:hypothetical protein
MTEHAACYETLGSRFTGSGSHRQDSCWSTFFQSADITSVSPPGTLFQTPIIPPSGFNTGNPPWTAGKIMLEGDVDTWTECMSSSNNMLQNGAIVANGNRPIRAYPGDINWNTGRVAPNLQTDIALPANPVGGEGQVTCRYQGEVYQGLAHFCEFEDDPPNALADGSARLTELLTLFDQATNRYTAGADAGGNAIELAGCGFSAVLPNGAVFIDPSDIGNGPDQMPALSVDNTAAAFRAHPGVFYPAGMTQYVRAITRQSFDQLELNFDVAGGPIAIWQVDSAPESTDWLVCIDGQYSIINLVHPAGSDYRRPRDIWNNVWQPIINSGGAVSLATIGGSVDNGSSAVGSISTRWKYATYFRCLKVPDTTNIPQAGGA